MPGGKIAINRGLLVELENEAELAAVLGHEIVHAAARHGVQKLNCELIVQLVLLGVLLAGDDIKHSSYVVGFGGVALHLINQKTATKKNAWQTTMALNTCTLQAMTRLLR